MPQDQTHRYWVAEDGEEIFVFSEEIYVFEANDDGYRAWHTLNIDDEHGVDDDDYFHRGCDHY